MYKQIEKTLDFIQITIELIINDYENLWNKFKIPKKKTID